MEFLTDRLLVAICALGVCIFVGRSWKTGSVIDEVRSTPGAAFGWAKLYRFLVGFVSPVAILGILIVSLIQGVTLS